MTLQGKGMFQGYYEWVPYFYALARLGRADETGGDCHLFRVDGRKIELFEELRQFYGVGLYVDAIGNLKGVMMQSTVEAWTDKVTSIHEAVRKGEMANL